MALSRVETSTLSVPPPLVGREPYFDNFPGNYTEEAPALRSNRRDTCSVTEFPYTQPTEIVSTAPVDSSLLVPYNANSERIMDSAYQVLSQIPGAVEMPYLLAAEASIPLPIDIDPAVIEQYICLEDFKDPNYVPITDRDGNLTEERIYFSGGTVSGKDDVAWGETWQIGLLVRKPGEAAYQLRPPVRIEGGKPKIATFPEGSTQRECAPAVWFDKEKQELGMLLQTDCFNAADIEAFKSGLDTDEPFKYVTTVIEGKDEVVNYDPEIMHVKNDNGDIENFVTHVKTPANERYHTIHFSQLLIEGDTVRVEDLGIYIDESDFPHQHQAGDPDASLLGFTPVYKHEHPDDDPEDEWSPEAPWFEERTLADGIEVIDGYIVTFRKRVGFDDQGKPEVRWKGTRQRLTKVRIQKEDWMRAIDSGRVEKSAAQAEGRKPELVKLPFEILGYVIDPGKDAECGHGSGPYIQRRERMLDGKLGKWQLYEIINNEDSTAYPALQISSEEPLAA